MITVLAQQARRRRSFSPTHIAGLQLWLKADAITGLADSAAVTTWADSSGTGHDASQSSATLKPLYKTNVVNGLPAILQDGTDDYMNIADFTLGTVFAVARYAQTSFGDYDGLFTTADNGSAENGIYFIGDQAAGTSWYASTQPGLTRYVDGTLTSTITPLNAWHVFMAVDSSPVSNAAGWRIGFDRANTVLARSWDGHYAEFIAYNTALSAADQARVLSYLRTKYAI